MEQTIYTDVFIAGAGASGIAAAVSVADCGLNVFVAEKNSIVGGRATASAVGTICGLYYRSKTGESKFVMNGFPKEFAERLIQVSGKNALKFSEGLWFLPCLPNDFVATTNYFLNRENIQVQYNTRILYVEYSVNNLTSVRCEQNGETIQIFAKTFIDCSGTGVLCASINHPVIADLQYQAAAIVFMMDGVVISGVVEKNEFTLSFTLMKQVMQQIDSKKIPEYFNLLSIVPGSLNDKSILFKFGLPWQVGIESNANEEMESNAKNLVHEAATFLKQNISGFEKSSLSWIANEVGIRTGIRAKGKNILTDHDVLNCIKHSDGICNGAWPVEYWRTGNKKVEITWFAENDFYTIPAGCLESPEKENLFFAGKIISAEEKAIASARVIGTCFGTGYAAGVLAAYKIKNQKRADAVEFIQNKILR